MDFWKLPPKFYMPLHGSLLEKGEELYKWQSGHLASALLLEDYNSPVEIQSCDARCEANFIFPKNALISGSFIMHHASLHLVGANIGIDYDDIDIYFQNITDAKEFARLNNIDKHFIFNDFETKEEKPMCSYGRVADLKLNLIYGVQYETPGDLISRFDIRACSMAIDPNSNMLYTVKGALEDTTNKRITFNPVPRAVSVRRLTKYIKKEFVIDGYQSLFFAELVRSPIYSKELELMTKEY